MGDDLSKTDMSQWHEISALRKLASSLMTTEVKLISGYAGVGRAYWRCWISDSCEALDEKVYGPTEEVLAVAVLEGK